MTENVPLSPKMSAAISDAQVDHDGELHVGWIGYVPDGTVSALRRRGLVNHLGQLTEAGKQWFNANVKD
jgi:hypothetical protein